MIQFEKNTLVIRIETDTPPAQTLRNTDRPAGSPPAGDGRYFQLPGKLFPLEDL